MAKVQIIYEKQKSYWPIFQMNAIRAKLHIIYKDHNMATRITLDNAYRGRRTKPPHPDATTTRATPETMKPHCHREKRWLHIGKGLANLRIKPTIYTVIYIVFYDQPCLRSQIRHSHRIFATL